MHLHLVTPSVTLVCLFVCLCLPLSSFCSPAPLLSFLFSLYILPILLRLCMRAREVLQAPATPAAEETKGGVVTMKKRKRLTERQTWPEPLETNASNNRANRQPNWQMSKPPSKKEQTNRQTNRLSYQTRQNVAGEACCKQKHTQVQCRLHINKHHNGQQDEIKSQNTTRFVHVRRGENKTNNNNNEKTS